MHGTIGLVNRITSEIRNAFEKREYCTAIFIDVSQAFDRVWLEGLMYKIKRMLPYSTHVLLESYLYDRKFCCAVHHCYISSLELEFLSTSTRLTTSTFADDTAIPSRSKLAN